MFSHNKFFITLIACTIANPCFAAGNSGTGRTTFQFFILGSCNCPENYYVAKCGDMDLDLGTINTRVKYQYNVDSQYWNDSYTDMHYLLHLYNNENKSYTTEFTTAGKILFYNTSAYWYKGNDDTDNNEIDKLSNLRTDIYKACLSSCTCTKCPNDGVTDCDTSVTTADDSTTYFENFNTIADCYTYGGSDGKGTFETVRSNPETEANRCYYSYSE